jgi:hypothetical protein
MQTSLLKVLHQVTKKSGGEHMKFIWSEATSQGTSLMIGSGPNANCKRSLSSHETGIVFSGVLQRLRKLKLKFGPWKGTQREANDDCVFLRIFIASSRHAPTTGSSQKIYP